MKRPAGFIVLPNDFFDVLVRYRLSGEERQCLDFIIRKTIGWNKKSDSIPLSQFTKATYINRQNVARALRKLAHKKIIDVIKKDNRGVSKYSVNMAFHTWLPVIKKDSMESILITGVIKKDSKGVIKKDTLKRQRTKDTLSKDISERFSKFYSAYPKKVDRGHAEKAFKAIDPDDALLEKMLAAIESQKANWNDRKFIPNPATWLNGKRWEDETQSMTDGGNGLYRSSLHIGEHQPGQVESSEPPSERDTLIRMMEHAGKEFHSFERLLADEENHKKYPDKIKEWEHKRDKAKMEYENIQRKLEVMEAEEPEQAEEQETEQAGAAMQEHDGENELYEWKHPEPKNKEIIATLEEHEETPEERIKECEDAMNLPHTTADKKKVLKGMIEEQKAKIAQRDDVGAATA